MKMALIGWTPDLNVGVPEIDKDHAHFVDLVNRLASADDDAFPELFEESYQHLETHFAMEEGLMQKYGFFAYVPHKAEHERVLAQTRTIQTQIASGDVETGRRYIEETITAWFINHRNTMDAVTANFIQMARRNEAGAS